MKQTFPRVRTYFWRQIPTSEGRSRPQLYICVQWLTQAIIPFKETGHLVNKCYGNLPVQRSLDSVLSSGGVRISEPREQVVTVDPGSSPDHDKLGEELGKVKCLLGGGGTHRTCKDGTKPYYKRAHAARTRIGRREMKVL